MTKAREIRCYDYVNHPYERVRAALAADAPRVFQAATRAATSRAHSVATALRVDIAGIEVGTDVVIDVGALADIPRTGKLGPGARLHLRWEAKRAPRLFPIMRAELSVYPLTATETQLDFLGHYEPPLGLVGEALDSLVGHRVAEASVHRLLEDVAGYLRATLRG
jgi:hypothetical protein